LASLNLSECFIVTDAGLEKIVAGCPSLTSLNINGCEQVTDAGLEKIAAGCQA
jgi:F-box/leucine-rich repeat protein 2/20